MISFKYFVVFILSLIRQTAAELNRKVKIHLKIDTGLHRVGFEPDKASRILADIINDPFLELAGLFSHYAYPSNGVVSRRQTRIFDRFVDNYKSLIPKKCLIAQWTVSIAGFDLILI